MADVVDLVQGQRTTKELGEATVTLQAPPGFVDPQWTKNGAAVSAASVQAVVSTAGKVDTYEVASQGGTDTASIDVRWQPSAPLNVKVDGARGSLKVSWDTVSNEDRIQFYEVVVDPMPDGPQLRRRTLGARHKVGGRREITINGLGPNFYRATVSAVTRYGNDLVASGATASAEVEVGEGVGKFPTGVRWLLGCAAALMFVGAVLLLIAGPLRDEVAVELQLWALAIGALVATSAALALAAVRRPAQLLSGADHRISTSRVNVALWTITVVFAIGTLSSVGIGAERFGRPAPCSAAPDAPPRAGADEICTDVKGNKRLAVDQLTIGDTFENGLAPNYLVLLGTPFLALAGARFVVGRQVDGNTRQKVEAESTSLADAVTNDDGDADLADSQYLLFTVVLLFYFYATFISSPYAFPDLPWGLVGLTGISAGTYLIDKAVTSNGLTVDALVPATVKTGAPAEVRILGRNFLPPGSAQLPRGGVQVMIGTTGVPVERVSDSEVAVIVDPSALGVGTHAVIVTTAANVAGRAGDLKVTT